MKNKLIVSIGFLVFSALSLLFLWKYAFLLSVVLLLTAYIKHRIYPIKKELLWFILLSVGGGLVEILLVQGANAWTYATPHVMGIPVWMPFFWGLVGTTIIVVYEGFLHTG